MADEPTSQAGGVPSLSAQIEALKAQVAQIGGGAGSRDDTTPGIPPDPGVGHPDSTHVGLDESTKHLNLLAGVKANRVFEDRDLSALYAHSRGQHAFDVLAHADNVMLQMERRHIDNLHSEYLQSRQDTRRHIDLIFASQKRDHDFSTDRLWANSDTSQGITDAALSSIMTEMQRNLGASVDARLAEVIGLAKTIIDNVGTSVTGLQDQITKLAAKVG